MVQSKDRQCKAFEGTVGIEEYRGKYRLNLARRCSRKYFGIEQKRFATGLTVCKENLADVEAKALAIHRDILSDNFDPEKLYKYGLGQQPQLTVIESIKPKELTLLELWNRYCEYKKLNGLAESTYINTYIGDYSKTIQSIPSSCTTAIDIRQYILSKRRPSRAKRVISALENCYDWAIKNKLASENPFFGMASEIKVPKAKRELPASIKKLDVQENSDEYKAFTKEERDAIVAEFENNKNVNHYASFVKFLFWTGCRPGEAIALKWKHISSDFTKIHFCESYALYKGKTYGMFKSTKTNEERWFKTGMRLQEFLRNIKPSNAKSVDLVFPRQNGQPIKWHIFCRTWMGCESNRQPSLIGRLIQQGKVKQYLKPYSTRHTYITLMLNEGINAIDIAKQVGNSPEIIMKHYASATRDLILPEV